MTSHRRLTTVALVAAISVGAVADTASSAGPKITKSGVGGVKLGKTYKKLRKEGLVGKIGPGCELAGPNTRAAKLKAPLKGSVNFTQSSPRKVTEISIFGGAKARGVGIGARIKDIKAKFPNAKVDHSTDETFEITLVRIPKSGGGTKFTFAVSTGSKRVTEIGIPTIPFCE
jgi:hypothetical protein